MWVEFAIFLGKSVINYKSVCVCVCVCVCVGVCVCLESQVQVGGLVDEGKIVRPYEDGDPERKREQSDSGLKNLMPKQIRPELMGCRSSDEDG